MRSAQRYDEQLVEEAISSEEEEEEESDDDGWRSHMHVHKGHACLAVLAALATGALVMLAVARVYLNPAEMRQGSAEATLGGSPAFSADTVAQDRESERGTCGPETQSFEWISPHDPYAERAVHHAFMLANTERHSCPGGTSMPPLPFSKAAFTDVEEHRHTVHVYFKYSPSCESETYKLAFHVAGVTAGENQTEIAAGSQRGGKNTSFIVEVNRNRETGAWSLLRSMPTPCNIQAGVALQPHSVPTSWKQVQQVGAFAADELSAGMRREGCLPQDGAPFEVADIPRAVVEVVEGLMWNITLDLANSTGAGNSPRRVTLIVLESCGSGKCVRQLALPDDSACSVFSATPVDLRLLSERKPGAVPSDPTELMEAQRHFITKPRRLQGERAPITVRHIREGAVPDYYNPTSNTCFQHDIVYNQGSCADCYAAATAVMIGIRLCMYNHGLDPSTLGRRLDAGKVATETGVIGTAPKQYSCSDSTTWSIPFQGQQAGCQWFALHDPGCKVYPDNGQRMHCQLTCNTCNYAEAAAMYPYRNADYRYMTSTTDVAQCTKGHSGEIRGCNGASPGEVWNNWMRTLTRDLWTDSASCMPYDLKCNGHVNLSKDLIQQWDCPIFEQYPLWHRPCSCIPKQDIPTGPLHCNETAPPTGCGIAVPVAWFVVKSVAQGLSISETVLNMQRHILEFGPLFVSVQQTAEFTHWDFAERPVYTGGKTVLGGHALLAVGWGTLGDTDYWIIRNSWSPRWGEHGYCKFQRGVNLDGVEEIGVDASMPTDNFQDWSEPVCHMSYMRWQWWITGSGLVTNYTGFVDIACNKPCDLAVFFSNRLESHNSVVDMRQGTVRYGSSAGLGKASTFMVNLLGAGFGKEAGDLLISIDSVDATGNKGVAKTSMHIPPAGG